MRNCLIAQRRNLRSFVARALLRMTNSSGLLIQPNPRDHRARRMVLFIAAGFLAAFAAFPQSAPPATLQFTADEAVARAVARARGDRDARQRAVRLEASRSAAARLPVVRAEGVVNDSRTADVFAQEPFELQSSSVLLAVDYPILDGGLSRARERAAIEEARRLGLGLGTEEAIFEETIVAYGDLYGVRRQRALVGEAAASLITEATRAEGLLRSGQMSRVALAGVQEAVLASRADTLALDLVALEAEARLRSVLGIGDGAEMIVDLREELDSPKMLSGAPDREAARMRSLERDALVAESDAEVARKDLALREAQSFQKPHLNFAGFAGISAARSNFGGIVSSQSGFGVYGARLTLSYPILDRARGLAVAKAKVELERSREQRALALEAAEARFAERWSRLDRARKRIELLEQWVRVAREREASLGRLTAAGVRSRAELASATGERARREGDLVRAKAQRWTLLRVLGGMTQATAAPIVMEPPPLQEGSVITPPPSNAPPSARPASPQPEATPARSPADPTRARYESMAREFAAKASPSEYTLQVELVCQNASIANALEKGKTEVWFTSTTYRGQNCFRVYWGRYRTREAAAAAAGEIPAALRGSTRPVVVSVRNVVQR